MTRTATRKCREGHTQHKSGHAALVLFFGNHVESDVGEGVAASYTVHGGMGAVPSAFDVFNTNVHAVTVPRRLGGDSAAASPQWYTVKRAQIFDNYADKSLV